MPEPTIAELLAEYERAIDYTDSLWTDLTDEQIAWRPHQESSAIGWHLGHQAAVSHYMVRNLTAAEPLIDPELDALMDSATAEADRGKLPNRDRLAAYRTTVAERVRVRIGNIDSGNVGAPTQLRIIAHTLLTATINHEYQHSKWIGEVRLEAHSRELPPGPASPHLRIVDGYFVIG